MTSGGVAATAAVLRRLHGKVAIITGGASGIGEATVHLFTNHGAKVIVADITDRSGSKLTKSISPRATFIHCNVSKEQDVSAAIDLAMEEHRRLDIMFNNAGIIDVQKGSMAGYDIKQFEHVMNVNVQGVMHDIKHIARVMIPNKRGCIISTASIAGMVGGISPYGYTASKHAIIGLTKNGAAELGKYGIKVNSISLGGLATNMVIKFLKKNQTEEALAEVEAFANSISNLKEATLKAEDIAEATLYLASEESKYVSSHNLIVDEGITAVNKD